MWRIISTRAKKLLSLLNSHTPRLQFQEAIWCQTFAMFLFIMSDTAETDMHPWTLSCQTLNVNLFLDSFCLYVWGCRGTFDNHHRPQGDSPFSVEKENNFNLKFKPEP